MREGYVETDRDVSIHYIVEGTGKPVLLLHGWPGYSFDWHKVVPLLKKEAMVIVPDFRGFGLSDKPTLKPAEGYSPEIMAQDMIKLLDHLDIQEAVVAAHDIGATIAQTLAKSYESRIGSLVLMNPPYPGIGARRFDPDVQPEFWYQHLHNLNLFEELFQNQPQMARTYVRFFYQKWMGREDAIRKDELATIEEVYARQGALLSSIMYYRARASAKTRQGIHASSSPVRQRTTVLWGDKDPVMRVEWSDRLADFFENCSLRKLPGIGHFVPLEAAEEVAGAIRSHL